MSNIGKGIFCPQIPIRSIILFISSFINGIAQSVAAGAAQGDDILGDRHLHQGLAPADMPKSLFVFKGYTVREKINWFLGADFSMVHLFPAVLADNLFISSVKFEVPFYIMQGDYDYMVSQALAKKYLDVIEAPAKEHFSFSNSAHSSNMEEPKKFIEIFRRIALENPPEKQGLATSVDFVEKRGCLTRWLHKPASQVRAASEQVVMRWKRCYFTLYHCQKPLKYQKMLYKIKKYNIF